MLISYCVAALFDELGLLVFVHGAMYMAFAALEQPQSIRSIGLHQTIGDCNATTPVHLPTGQVNVCVCVSLYGLLVIITGQRAHVACYLCACCKQVSFMEASVYESVHRKS